MKLTNRMSFLRYLLFVAHLFLGWGFDGSIAKHRMRDMTHWSVTNTGGLDPFWVVTYRLCDYGVQRHTTRAQCLKGFVKADSDRNPEEMKWISFASSYLWHKRWMPTDNVQIIWYISHRCVCALLSKSSIEHFNGLKRMLINKRHENILLIFSRISLAGVLLRDSISSLHSLPILELLLFCYSVLQVSLYSYLASRCASQSVLRVRNRICRSDVSNVLYS